MSEEINLQKDKTASLENQVKKVGRVSIVVGWLEIAINILVFIWSISDKNFSDSGLPAGGIVGLLIACGSGAVFIALGKQIKQLENTIQNIWILIGLSILIIIVAGATGGSVGLILLIFIVYLIRGLIDANKLKKS